MDKIICFGKNYADHMLELGDKPVEKPVIFFKPASVLKQCGNWSGSLKLDLTGEETHYETEIVIRLSKGGYRLSVEQAEGMIDAYTIGLDMTLRKIQAKLKADGHPWTIGKVFPNSAVIGPWIATDNLDFLTHDFSFNLNGQVKQNSQGINMLFKPWELISYASQFFPLCAGDILFTGTPSGVGKIQSGDSANLQLGLNRYSVEWL